jgi:hypothetical protein
MYFSNAGQPFALFYDLLDCSVISSRHDSHPRPKRIVRLSNGQRFDVETARAEQPDDARKLTRLVSYDNGKCVTHGISDWQLPIADLFLIQTTILSNLLIEFAPISPNLHQFLQLALVFSKSAFIRVNLRLI